MRGGHLGKYIIIIVFQATMVLFNIQKQYINIYFCSLTTVKGEKDHLYLRLSCS